MTLIPTHSFSAKTWCGAWLGDLDPFIPGPAREASHVRKWREARGGVAPPPHPSLQALPWSLPLHDKALLEPEPNPSRPQSADSRWDSRFHHKPHSCPRSYRKDSARQFEVAVPGCQPNSPPPQSHEELGLKGREAESHAQRPSPYFRRI